MEASKAVEKVAYLVEAMAVRWVYKKVDMSVASKDEVKAVK